MYMFSGDVNHALDRVSVLSRGVYWCIDLRSTVVCIDVHYYVLPRLVVCITLQGVISSGLHHPLCSVSALASGLYQPLVDESILQWCIMPYKYLSFVVSSVGIERQTYMRLPSIQVFAA